MRAILSATLLLAATASAAAGEALFRHPEAAYPHLDLSWQPLPGLGAYERIWPHPLLPGVVALTGERGLALSTDGGATWAVPAGLPAGAVGGIAFHPSALDESLVATRAGLWRRQDGRAYVRMPLTDLPPPTGVWYHPCDPLGRIILVTHGDEAPGISLSCDGGETWKQLIPEYHIHRVFPFAIGEKSLAMLASSGADPSLRTLLSMTNLGDKPLESLRDGVIADSANPVHVGKMHFASPRDGLLALAAPRDFSIREAEPVQTAPASADGFSALDFSWGATADRQLLFLFDPFKLGVVYNTGDDVWHPAGSGLPVGAMVKDGAQFRANANGSRFFAIVNDRAYLGRPLDLRLDGLHLQVEPPVAMAQTTRYAQAVNALSLGFRDFNRLDDPVAVARGMRGALDGLDAAAQPAAVRLRVRLAPGTVPERLTVDLTRFGRSEAEPLHDDGRHDDGAAGDGTWASEVRIRPGRLAPSRGEWRRTPGILGLSVTARWADGTCSGAVAPLLVWSVVERLTLVDRIGKAEESLTVEGLTTAIDKVKGQDPVLRFVANGGPWKLTVRFNCMNGYVDNMFGCIDMGPFAKIGFDWIGGAADLRLLDAPIYEEPHESDSVKLAGGLLGKPGAEGWRAVAVPISSLVKVDSEFSHSRLAALVLSGDAKPGAEFRLRSPCLLPEDWP